MIASFFNLPYIGRFFNQLIGLLYDGVSRLKNYFNQGHGYIHVDILVLSQRYSAIEIERFITQTSNELQEVMDVQVVKGTLTIDHSAPFRARRPSCNLKGWWADLGKTGVYYDRKAAPYRKSWRQRRLLLVVVDDFADGFTGCALGPFTDYLHVTTLNSTLLRHELMHKCGLMHRKQQTNLMHPKCQGTDLTKFQRHMARSSSFIHYA
ncbi:MAG: hypothetical protein RL226_1927 [Bacteroidota bacterium]